MICSTCEKFLTNIINQDFTTWTRRQSGNPNHVTFTCETHTKVATTSDATCKLCRFFNRVLHRGIIDQEVPNDDCQGGAISLDYEIEHGREDGRGSEWRFELLPKRPEFENACFEIFKLTQRSDNDNTSVDAEMPLAVSTIPTSPSVIQIVRSWIDRCLGGPGEGITRGMTALPTRLIDVGHYDGTPKPRLQITDGQLDRYLTLSHCWGTGQRLTLVQRNLKTFQKEIPFNLLSKTFQDAIKLTSILGFRYMWIDALCIIQDDPDDWRIEAASMCAVYENAFFSISALAAEDTHSGFLHDRNLQQIEVEVEDIRLGVRTRLDSLPMALSRSRLESRAWCLQERLLPRAILHVNHDQFFWECRTCSASEVFPKMLDHNRDCLEASNIFRVGRGMRKGICENWRSLVCKYSERQVTQFSDRLPAIAGLAELGSKELNNSAYIQGIWSGDIHAGLLWRRNPDLGARTCSKFSGPERTQVAASWSWASINGAIDYAILDEFNVPIILPTDADFKRNKIRERNVSPCPAGCLQVDALVKRGTYTLERESAAEVKHASFKARGSLQNAVTLNWFLDDLKPPLSKPCYCMRVANWTNRSESEEETEVPAEIAAYIILQWLNVDSLGPEHQSRPFGVFRRIGVGHDEPKKVDSVFANAKRRYLQLI